MTGMVMCPHCGALFGVVECEDRLVPYHEYQHIGCYERQECPGVGQNPRNPESDRRPLWNGQANPHAQ